MSRKGFTLIELLVVVSIISLLSSVVLSSLNSAREKARLAAARAFSSQTDRAIGDLAVGTWDFDECSSSTVIDRSGFGNNGTLGSAASWSTDTQGGSGCSLRFNGTNGPVTIPDSNALDLTSAATLAVWYKKDVGSGTNRWLVDKGPVNSSYAMFIEGGLKMRLMKPGMYDCTTTEPSEGVWHHVVSTYDGSNIEIYVDGKLARTCATSGMIIVTSGTVNIGAYGAGGSGYPFMGQIDGVRVYSTALTASEIGRMYAQEARRYEVARMW